MPKNWPVKERRANRRWKGVGLGGLRKKPKQSRLPFGASSAYTMYTKSGGAITSKRGGIVEGNHNLVDGYPKAVNGDHNVVHAHNVTVHGNHNTVVGNHTKTLGNHNVVVGDDCRVVGKHNRVVGERNDVEGRFARTLAPDNAMVDDTTPDDNASIVDFVNTGAINNGSGNVNTGSVGGSITMVSAGTGRTNVIQRDLESAVLSFGGGVAVSGSIVGNINTGSASESIVMASGTRSNTVSVDGRSLSTDGSVVQQENRTKVRRAKTLTATGFPKLVDIEVTGSPTSSYKVQFVMADDDDSTPFTIVVSKARGVVSYSVNKTQFLVVETGRNRYKIVARNAPSITVNGTRRALRGSATKVSIPFE